MQDTNQPSNHILFGSAIFAGLTNVANRQTNSQPSLLYL